jgi:uncharacterized protein
VNADLVKKFVIAGHGNLESVRSMLEAQPDLLNAAHEWRPNDDETALQAASHVGNCEIALYLLERGAPLTITTAAMLGDVAALEELLIHDSSLIASSGAHGISLLVHAVMSDNAALVSDLISRGAVDGASMALNVAVDIGELEVVQVLMTHTHPDLHWKNMKGKSALELAVGNLELLELLERMS